ncbi:glycerol-3-phosphate dehydrogenase [Flavimaribacter sediminis]|nr:glycerol-3-phosphate dehydrogenase [Flavimaribacter sediminis]
MMQQATDTAGAEAQSDFDLLIIGGGVNGAGIARDAAGRGYSVCLCEAGDFGGGTSSASTKLLHGGLRYLEYFELRLVREALIERENLLVAMPHISWPMRFVLPCHDDMRFDSDTPTSRLLSVVMPWMKGRRPNWLIRLGLFLYDNLGGRRILPPTRTLDLSSDKAGKPLKPDFRKAFEYSDGWVEDSRLVILNLRDAQRLGAEINPHNRVTRANFADGRWTVTLSDTEHGAVRTITASMIINASGPWVDDVLKSVFGQNDAHNVRLVRGSHIVVPRKYDHDRCYFFQNADGRIIFAIPFQDDYTLIGTTDADHPGMNVRPEITDGETAYLCRMASEYFEEPVRAEDIVWTYSGVRPLYDDGASSAQSATRDYVVRRDPKLGHGTLINIFGGKITTFRRLSESVVEEVEHTLGKRGKAWTCKAPLPGGDFPVDGYDDLVGKTANLFPFVEKSVIARLVRFYGTDVDQVLAGCESLADLGQDFGHGLYEAELRYLIECEWARNAQDALFRRTKLGIRMSDDEVAAVEAFMARHLGKIRD